MNKIDVSVERVANFCKLAQQGTYLFCEEPRRTYNYLINYISRDIVSRSYYIPVEDHPLN